MRTWTYSSLQVMHWTGICPPWPHGPICDKLCGLEARYWSRHCPPTRPSYPFVFMPPPPLFRTARLQILQLDAAFGPSFAKESSEVKFAQAAPISLPGCGLQMLLPCPLAAQPYCTHALMNKSLAPPATGVLACHQPACSSACKCKRSSNLASPVAAKSPVQYGERVLSTLVNIHGLKANRKIAQADTCSALCCQRSTIQGSKGGAFSARPPSVMTQD